MPTPHNTTANSLKVNPTSTGAAVVSPLVTGRWLMDSTALSGSSPSDDDNYRQLSPSSSDDSNSEQLSPPSPPPTKPSKTERSVIQELVLENEKLKKDLSRKTKKLENQGVKLQEQVVHNEELKTQNEMYKNKMQLIEEDAILQLEAKDEQISKHTSLIGKLEKQVASLQLAMQKVEQEKQSLEQAMQGSVIPTRGPISRLQSSRSLGHMRRISESSSVSSSSLTSINEIEEFKYEINRIDAMLHSKLNHLDELCQNTIWEPSNLNRRWRSDIALAQQPHSHHNQESNSLFMHSQT